MCWVTQKQTIPSLNDLSIVFQSPLSVVKWRLCTEEEGHVCEAPWDHAVGQWGCTLMPCVWWCVVPAGFASGRGYLAAGDPIWSG